MIVAAPCAHEVGWPSWENRFDLISLWEIMQEFDIAELFSLYQSVFLFEQAPRGQAYLPNEIRKLIRTRLARHRQTCERLGLRLSVKHIDRIVALLDKPDLTSAELGRDAGEQLLQRVGDELASILFLHVQPDRAHYYSEPIAGWDDVLKKFPSTRFDVEEAGKCFALNRYTASVFHAMRVLEAGLTSLGHHFKVPTDRANWHDIITAIEKKVRALGPNDGANWHDEQQFGSEACTEFRHFKDAWRNHAMHVRQTFDDERARVIYEHVRGFMAHLATRLKERR